MKIRIMKNPFLFVFIFFFSTMTLYSQKFEYKIYTVSTIKNGVQSDPEQKFMTAYKTEDNLTIENDLSYQLQFFKKVVEGMNEQIIYNAIDKNGQPCIVAFANDPSKLKMLQHAIIIVYSKAKIWYVFNSNPPTKVNE